MEILIKRRTSEDLQSRLNELQHKMKTTKMRAMVSTGYGGPEVLQLQKVKKPVPDEYEVLVKIMASSITTAETMMRTGYPLIGRLFTGLAKPKNRISGTGFSGVIEAIGEKVSQFKIGDRVFGESLDHFGTYAEYVCVKEQGIIEILPKNISFEEAAAVGDGPITSLNFLKNLGQIKAKDIILVIGASGSLGSAAVQLAKNHGAHVTGVCSHKNIEYVKSLGVDKAINYQKEDFLHSELTYDIIYDTVGKSSFSKCKDALTSEGVYMSPILNVNLLFQMLWTSMASKKKAKFAATGMLPHKTIRAYFKEIGSQMERGNLKCTISRRFSIDQIPAAHREIEKGHKRGNFIVDLNLQQVRYGNDINPISS